MNVTYCYFFPHRTRMPHFVVRISFSVLCHFISTAIQNENEKKENSKNNNWNKNNSERHSFDSMFLCKCKYFAAATKGKKSEKFNLRHEIEFAALQFTRNERTANEIPSTNEKKTLQSAIRTLTRWYHRILRYECAGWVWERERERKRETQRCCESQLMVALKWVEVWS